MEVGGRTSRSIATHQVEVVSRQGNSQCRWGVGHLDQLPLRWRWPEDKEMRSGGGGSDV